MIISVVAAKIWYLKNVRFLLGHPVHRTVQDMQIENVKGHVKYYRMARHW